MTGEITLRGRVLQIGGFKQKVLAAHRAGMKMIIFPKENEKHMVEIPRKIQKKIKFQSISTIDEVIRHAIVGADNFADKTRNPKKNQKALLINQQINRMA